MHIIDSLTEFESYINLLHYLMHGDGASPEERMASIEAHQQVERGPDTDFESDIEHAAVGSKNMKTYTGMMRNFISRHADGYDTTQDMVDTEFEQFKIGVLRVARKILGENNDGYDTRPDNKAKVSPVAQYAGGYVVSSFESLGRGAWLEDVDYYN